MSALDSDEPTESSQPTPDFGERAGTHSPRPLDSAGILDSRFRGDDSADVPIACICIDPRFVDRVWPFVAHLIRAAMEKGRISDFADVEHAVLEGRALLWVAADARAIWAAAVTQLAYVAGEKLCTIVACGGRERTRWLGVISELEAYAKQEGCAAIRIFGRRGWARALPDYRLSRVLLEKSL